MPNSVWRETTSVAMRELFEGRVMSEGTSLNGRVPEVHGTPTPRPWIGAESGVSPHLSQHSWPHVAGSEHATQTLQPRASRHLKTIGGLDCIKTHVNASVDGAGNKQKHRGALSATELFSLSVSFFGHDQRVTNKNKLPPRVCSPDARQLPMSNFHSR